MRPTLEDILLDACVVHDVPMEELLGPSRSPMYVLARRTAARRARECGYSYPEIGRAMRRYHSTVMNYVRSDGWEGRLARRSRVEVEVEG